MKAAATQLRLVPGGAPAKAKAQSKAQQPKPADDGEQIDFALKIAGRLVEESRQRMPRRVPVATDGEPHMIQASRLLEVTAQAVREGRYQAIDSPYFERYAESIQTALQTLVEAREERQRKQLKVL